MDDAEEFPSSFEEWEDTAWRQIDGMRSGGAVIQQIFLDPDQFLAFCEKKGLAKDGNARAEYVASIWRRRKQNRGNRSRINI
jgi:hypothetical protein